MKKLWLLAAFLAAPAALSGASAADQAKPSDPDKKICRTENVTGSRTRVNRICMTRAEWEELAQQTRQGMDDVSRRATSQPSTKTSPF